MALTDSGLKALLPKEKKYRVSVGDALYMLVYPNGGQYFVWNIGFLPTDQVSSGTTKSVLMGRVQGSGP